MDKRNTHVIILLSVYGLGILAEGYSTGNDVTQAGHHRHSKLLLTTQYHHQKLQPDTVKQSQKRLVGRHVCTHNKVIMKPVKRTESYCKPSYQTYIRRCDHTAGNAYCTGYRVIYDLAFRVVEKLIAHTEVSYSCCPGWTHTNWSHECKKAICSSQCLNGGSCLKPNQCLCIRGWSGKYCETSTSAEDKSSGREEAESMKRRILRLEKNMASLFELKSRFDNLNQIVNRFVIEKPSKEERSIKHGDKRISLSPLPSDGNERDPPKDSAVETAEDRIQLLSEQMAILEERLADCTCVLKEDLSILPTAR